MLETFKHPFPSLKFKHTTGREIEDIIKSLKTEHYHGYDEPQTPFIGSLMYVCMK